MRPLALGILGSGKGSNCRAILKEIRDGKLPAEVRIVVSDVLDAGILAVAEEFGVPTVHLDPGKWRTKLDPAAETELVRLLSEAGVELVVLAGFMRILKTPVLDEFSHRIINIHPSLLPKYPGREAWAQALAAGERTTGCTVHFVDVGIDTGEIIAQREVPILPNDSAASLHARIQSAEGALYPAVLRQLANVNRARISDRAPAIPASPERVISPDKGRRRPDR
jgi:phosphoribosylglycinamide formyltransferase-1